VRPFVALHIAGWLVVLGLFTASDLSSSSGYPFIAAAADASTQTVVGFALTSALWAGYRRVRLPARPAWLSVGAVAASVLGAGLWCLTSYLLWHRGEESEYGWLGGELFMDVVLLLAWHGAALSARSLLRAATAERLAQEARLAALRYQINPHFLFNALNSAIAMIDEDPARAQAMLTRLASLLRLTLRDTAATTTIDEELDVIERYIEIERVRFEEKLQVRVEASPRARACRLPPLLLHALVENAIKYGMRTSPMPLEVSIEAELEGAALRVEVANSGKLVEQRPEAVGLTNVRGRLEALYAGRHTFALTEDDGRVRARIHIDRPEGAEGE
jgi:two-component system sensor histidine kinase AlgZ